MLQSAGPPTADHVPDGWDQLQQDPHDEKASSIPAADPQQPPTPSVLMLFGSAWGDLVTVLAVCTAGLTVLRLLGYGSGWRAVPWAVGVGVVWWVVSASVLLVIRNGTPGMLMAGVVFASRVPGERGIWTLLAALATWLTLGLPSLLGAGLAPIRIAAGVGLICAPPVDALDTG